MVKNTRVMPVAIVCGVLAMYRAWRCSPYAHILNFCNNSERLRLLSPLSEKEVETEKAQAPKLIGSRNRT